MNVLFVGQSEAILMFQSLSNALSERVKQDKVGFVVSDSWAYEKWLAENPDFEQQGYLLLKEWNVTSERTENVDQDLLRKYEDEIGAEPGLFGAIVADRRLFMGPDCTYTQDYRRRFSDSELLSILQVAIQRVGKLFDELKPDVVVSFICVTALDYIVYLFAKSRGVRICNLRTTRIADRIIFGSTLNDPTPEFVDAYERCLESGSRSADTAKAYIKRVREKHGRYEGVVRPSEAPAQKINREGRNPLSSVVHLVRNYLSYRFGNGVNDNHVANPLRALFFAAVANRLQAKRVASKFKDLYITKDRLKHQRYVFFPLHTEPEISLLVYGRPFLNQIEVIRQLAISLPVDMILVLKEHPWMVGKRTVSAYQKMLNIPRVHLADPSMEARELIEGSSLVSVITGSVALEAAIIGKPVITFGDCPFNLLPDGLVQRCKDLRHLPELIKKMLSSDAMNHHEKALEAYLSAVYETSESINLYSVLLQKKGVFSLSKTSYDDEMEKLANYLMQYITADLSESTGPKVAIW